MRRVIKIAAATSVAALMLAACGSSGAGSAGTGTSPTPSDTAPTTDVKVGLAYDVGGRGDQSFNDSAAVGLELAATETGITFKELAAAPSGETDATREERLVQLAEAGYNPIIAIGFAYGVALGKVAPEYPDTNFAIIDDASLADAAERRQPGVRRGAGQLPGRLHRGAGLEDRQRSASSVASTSR